MKKKKIKDNKKYWVAGAGLTVAILAFVAIKDTSLVAESLPHSNKVDTKISLRAIQPINSTAITADPELKHITFETNSPDNVFDFKNQIAAVVKTLKSIAEPKIETPEETGTWLWTPTMQLTPEYSESILSGAAKNGINTIYISIDSYLDIFVMQKGAERERLKKEFSQKLEDFIVRANKKGIAVDAEAGWKNWAEPDHTYKAFAIVNFVKNFNDTHQNKFRGFQYDVEPYLLDEYLVDPAPVLQRFVELVDKTEVFLANSDLRFSVVIPDFYDEKDKMLPKFSYAKKKKSVVEHLLNILDRRNQSSLIIMSYRTFADGHDGSIEISQNEMQTANRGRYDTKIIIAQETGDVPPPYITFHRTSKEHLNKQISRIKETFGKNENFGGIAIHYVNSFLALK